MAIDEKYVRNLVLTPCLSEHESRAPAAAIAAITAIAIAIAELAPASPENKKDGELTCAA